jgi:hypothetical protein
VCNSDAPSIAPSPAPTTPSLAPSTKIAPKGLNAATIAGIIVAVLVLLFLGFVLFLAQRRRAKDHGDQASTDNYVQMTDRKFQRRGPSDSQLRELSLQVFFKRTLPVRIILERYSYYVKLNVDTFRCLKDF